MKIWEFACLSWGHQLQWLCPLSRLRDGVVIVNLSVRDCLAPYRRRYVNAIHGAVDAVSTVHPGRAAVLAVKVTLMTWGGDKIVSKSRNLSWLWLKVVVNS